MYEIWFSRSLVAFALCARTQTLICSLSHFVALRTLHLWMVISFFFTRFIVHLFRFCRRTSWRARQSIWWHWGGSEMWKLPKSINRLHLHWFLMVSLPCDMKVELFRHFSPNEKLVYFIRVYKNNQLILRNNTFVFVSYYLQPLLSLSFSLLLLQCGARIETSKGWDKNINNNSETGCTYTHGTQNANKLLYDGIICYIPQKKK